MRSREPDPLYVAINRDVLTLNTFFFSSEDFPASGVLLQRSDEATEEKAVFDTLLAGSSTVAKETKKKRNLHFFCDYTSAL